MSDATTAAKAIQALEYHEPADSPGGRAYAHTGVVLARLSEAIMHLEAILQKHEPITEGHEFCACGAWPRPCFEQEHAVAALAALQGEA